MFNTPLVDVCSRHNKKAIKKHNSAYQLPKVIDGITQKCRQSKVIGTTGLLGLQEVINIHASQIEQCVLVVLGVFSPDLSRSTQNAQLSIYPLPQSTRDQIVDHASSDHPP